MLASNQQKMFESIVHWQQSGLTQKAWCAEHAIAYSRFHYWYKRFRNQQAKTSGEAGEGFVELMVSPPPSGSPWCELVLGEGKRLLFHQAVPAEFLNSLLA